MFALTFLFFSRSSHAQCGAITNLVATDSDCRVVYVTWNLTIFNPPPRPATAIYRGVTPTDPDARLLAFYPTNPFVDDQVEPGVTYYYWVAYGSFNDLPLGVAPCVSAGPEAGVRIGPDAPSGITVGYGTRCDGVLVSWVGTPNLNRYEVWRNTVNNAAGSSRVSADAAVPFLDQDPAIIGLPVYYFVQAINRFNNCSSEPSAGAGPGYRGVPLAATNLTASRGSYCSRVRLDWPPINGHVTYEVWRGRSTNMATAGLIGVISTEGYNDVPPTVGDSYYYWVRAVNSCGPGAFSSPAIAGWRSVGSPMPTNLRATDRTTCVGVELVWDPVADPSEIAGYEILRADSDDFATATLIASPTGTAATDESAERERTYFYWVRSRGPCGNSPPSNSDAGTRRGTAPTIQMQPSSVTVDEGQNGTLTVVASGFGATTIRWFHYDSPVVNGGRISGATTPTLAFAGVTPADEGWYRVAVTDTCDSVYSRYVWLRVAARRLYDNSNDQYATTFASTDQEVGDVLSLAPEGFQFELQRGEVLLSRSGPFAGDLTLAVYAGAPSNNVIPIATSTLTQPRIDPGGGAWYVFPFQAGTNVPGQITFGLRSTTWNRLEAHWGDPPGIGTSAQFFYVRTAVGWQQRTLPGINPENMSFRAIGRVIQCASDVDDGSGVGRPDGGVTVEDLLFFLAQYVEGDARVDLDDGSNTGTPDGGVTIDDLLYYLLRFEAGC